MQSADTVGKPPGEARCSGLSSRKEAAELLVARGGDPLLSSSTAAAAETLFIELQRRFNPLVGREGYRALLQEAHRRAVRHHPVLERYPVSLRGNPFFGGLGAKMAGEDPEKVWRSLTTLTEEFLDLTHAMGREGETIRRQAGNAAVRAPEEGIAAEPFDQESPVAEEFPQLSPSALAFTDPWRVVVLDPDQESCDRTAQSLCRARDFEIQCQCVTVRQAREQLSRRRADFVVADARLPSGELFDLCRWLRSDQIEAPPHVVVTGLPRDPDILLSLLETGVAAFTLEEFSVAGLRVTLRLLARKESVFPLRLQHLMSLRISEFAELVRDRGLEPDLLWNLTSREGRVLLLLEQHLANREIARRLFISEGTVKSHVHQILKKLRVRDREQAVKILQFQRASPGQLTLGKNGFEREARRA